MPRKRLERVEVCTLNLSTHFNSLFPETRMEEAGVV